MHPCPTALVSHSPSNRGCVVTVFLGPALRVQHGFLDTGEMRCWRPVGPCPCRLETPRSAGGESRLDSDLPPLAHDPPKAWTPASLHHAQGHHLTPRSPATAGASGAQDSSLYLWMALPRGTTRPAAPTPTPAAGLPTGQLFLDLCAPGGPQEADGLADPALPAGLQLVGGAPEHQVAQRPGRGLLHVLVGAAEEVHQLADAAQLIDLGDR